MHGAEHVAAPGIHSGLNQFAVEGNPLVAERVTLIHADHRLWEPRQLLKRCPIRPGHRIAVREVLDAVGHGRSVSYEIDEDPVVFGRAWQFWSWVLTGNERTERIDPLHEIKAPFVLQLETNGKCEISTTTLSAHDNLCWIDSQVLRMPMNPLQPRDAVVETAGEWRDVLHRTRLHRIAELHHHDTHSVVSEDLRPRAVIAHCARQ